MSGFTGTDPRERECQGCYETDALDDLLAYESKKFDKVGRHILKIKNLETEVYILNPEAGIPSIV
jgi:hypothetical protein